MPGERIAVLGAGPMGLAVAYQLARDGHHPVLFEADDRGSLTWVEMRSTESDMAWSLLLITIYDGDLVGRWEQFSVDDLPAALDRYHELVASDGPGGGLNPSGKR